MSVQREYLWQCRIWEGQRSLRTLYVEWKVARRRHRGRMAEILSKVSYLRQKARKKHFLRRCSTGCMAKASFDFCSFRKWHYHCQWLMMISTFLTHSAQIRCWGISKIQLQIRFQLREWDPSPNFSHAPVIIRLFQFTVYTHHTHSTPVNLLFAQSNSIRRTYLKIV